MSAGCYFTPTGRVVAVAIPAATSLTLFPGTAGETTVDPGETVEIVGLLGAGDCGGGDAAQQYVVGGFVIPVYNGSSGLNPRGFDFGIRVSSDGEDQDYTLAVRSADIGPNSNSRTGSNCTTYGERFGPRPRIKVTNDADTTGSIRIQVGVPEYGEYPGDWPGGAHYEILLIPQTTGDLLDTFDGAATTTGFGNEGHVPAIAPAIPGGEEPGWHGTGGFSHNLTGAGRVRSGGNSGGMRYARHWAGWYDSHTFYGDFIRQPALGASQDISALVVRGKKVAGNSDAGWDGIQFYAEKFGTDTVRLSWIVVVGGAGTAEKSDNFATINWARNTGKRLWVRVAGATVRFYVSDFGGTDNIQLVATANLVTNPLNDSSHQYVGFGMTYLTASTDLETLESLQVSLAPVDEVALTCRLGQVPAAVDVPLDADLPGFPIGSLAVDSISYAEGSGWLAAALSDVTTPATLTITPQAGIATMTPGTYHATVHLTSDGDADGGDLDIDVVLVINPPPCTVQLDVYEDDGTTVKWSVITARGGENPYLRYPDNYASQELDIPGGSASVGTVRVTVVDPAQTPGDQTTGWMTERLTDAGVPDLAGRRCRLRLYVNDTVGWQNIADGPAGLPSLDGWAAYSWEIRDTREIERKARAFDVVPDGLGRTLFPEGSASGYGHDALLVGDYLLDAQTPMRATFHQYSSPSANSGYLEFNTSGGNDSVPRRAVTVGTYEQLKGSIGDKTQTGLPGYPQYEYKATFPNLRVRWRAYGSSDPWTVIEPVSIHVLSEVASWYLLDEQITTLIQLVRGGAQNDDLATVGLSTATHRLAAYVLLGDEENAGVGLPGDTDDVEFFIEPTGAISTSNPALIDDMTAGDFLAALYDGDWSTEPQPIRYEAAAVAALTTPVRAMITKPIEDVRDFVEKYVYRPLGYVAALNADGEISPVSQVPPADTSGLLTVSDANARPAPDWSAGQRIVNLLRFTYPRDYRPILVTDGGGLIAGEITSAAVTVEREDALSIARHGEQLLEIDGSLFRAVANFDGNPITGDVTDEVGFQLAQERDVYLFERYRYGAPSYALDVMRSAFPDTRAGDWVLVSLSWLPDYLTGQRGLTALAQVLKVEDLDCAWRRFLLEQVPEADS